MRPARRLLRRVVRPGLPRQRAALWATVYDSTVGTGEAADPPDRERDGSE